MKPDEILRRAHAVGASYGFTSFAHAALKNRGARKVAPFPDSLALDSLDSVGRDVASFLKQVRDASLAPSVARPLFLWHTNAASGRPAPRTITVQFHAIGADRAIADAVLLRAVRSFIADITKEEPAVRVNSMGDRETRGRLSRELTQFFRKHGPILPADCVACARRDVFEAAEQLANGEHENIMPNPTDHLSEASRKHFEHVLEYLEATETPYELAPTLLSRGPTWTETCFEVRVEESTSGQSVHAWGSRYLELAKHFFKEAMPSIGAVVRIMTGLTGRAGKAVMPSMRERSAPRFVFVHIGDEAKRESMKMTDVLRRARIPLAQSIGVESLTEQMRLADVLDPPYLLIMGRKEALERSVILRERSTHTESLIPFDSLVEQLRQVA